MTLTHHLAATTRIRIWQNANVRPGWRTAPATTTSLLVTTTTTTTTPRRFEGVVFSVYTLCTSITCDRVGRAPRALAFKSWGRRIESRPTRSVFSMLKFGHCSSNIHSEDSCLRHNSAVIHSDTSQSLIIKG